METEKTARLLYLYRDFVRGKGIVKQEAAAQFGVNERSIQRDIENLRDFFAEQTPRSEIIYDAKERRYRLIECDAAYLSNSEALAVCKVLLESRSMRKDEMLPILDKLISCCVPEENKNAVQALLSNETYHYIESHHQQRILDGLWELGLAVREQREVEIAYERLKEPHIVKRIVQPVGIMFSEFYFYLTAFLKDKESFENPDDLFPTIYRIDRIQSFRVLDEHFSVPYKDRFQEGEFRKRVQFMYGGRLERIRFRYTGPSIESVLDRLPTAEIIAQDEDGWTVKAEVFGKGIEMWLRSQGEYVRVVTAN